MVSHQRVHSISTQHLTASQGQTGCTPQWHCEQTALSAACASLADQQTQVQHIGQPHLHCTAWLNIQCMGWCQHKCLLFCISAAQVLCHTVHEVAGVTSVQVWEAPILAANVSKVWPGDVSMPLGGAGVQQGQGRACSTHAGRIPSLQPWHCVALTRMHKLCWLPALRGVHRTRSAALTSSKPSPAACLVYNWDSADALLPLPGLAAHTHLHSKGTLPTGQSAASSVALPAPGGGMPMQGGSAYCMASMTSGTCSWHMLSSLAGCTSWHMPEPRVETLQVTQAAKSTDQGKPPGQVRPVCCPEDIGSCSTSGALQKTSTSRQT